MQTKVKDLRDAEANEPMSEDLSKLFVTATLNELNGDDRMFTSEAASTAGFIAQIIHRRLEVMSPGTKISLGTGLIAAFNSFNNPGRAVLWAYTLHRMFKDSDRTAIMIQDVANAFPMGFPDEYSFLMLWDSQKTTHDASDNLLDLPSTWL